MQQALWIVLAAVNAATFFLFGWDKWMAVRGKRRVPEARLLLFTLAMGAVGAWIGVRVFRHKTRKTSFRIPLVLATLANIAAYAFAGWWFFVR